MKVRFLLKKKGKNPADAALIFLALYYKDHTELISTGQKIQLKHWNSNDQYPRLHTGQVAKAIEQVKAKVNLAITRIEARQGFVTPFSVKEEYLRNLDNEANEQIKKDLATKQNRRVIKVMVNDWLSHSIFQYRPSTQKAIRESLTQFVSYLVISGNASLERQDLTLDLVRRYEEYLQVKKKLSNSTHGKRMKHLRWFLKSIDFDVKPIKIRTHQKEIIALTEDELQKLESIDVGNSSEMQKAKDLFLLGCYTGLRISDLKRINPTRIIDGRISMMLKKNSRPVTIPVLPVTSSILARYNQKAPSISEQVLNRAIKEVCKDAGIDTTLTVRENKAGIDIDVRYKKFDLITSHTASKTFITTVAPGRFGLTPEEIAAVVGKDLKTLLNHYFKLPLEAAIKKMTIG